VEFLRTFYKVFPEYESVDVGGFDDPRAQLNSGLQTYLGGESYAGQYIPYFGTNSSDSFSTERH
jgi:carboxypeptidase D